MYKVRQKKKVLWTKLNTCILLVIILLLTAVIVPVTKYYLSCGNARDVLRSAKTVKLAAEAISYDYRSEDSTFVDQSNESGLRKEADGQIMKLSGCNGKIEYLSFDEQDFQVTKLIYIELDFCAVFEKVDEKPNWTVYQLNKMVDF